MKRVLVYVAGVVVGVAGLACAEEKKPVFEATTGDFKVVPGPEAKPDASAPSAPPLPSPPVVFAGFPLANGKTLLTCYDGTGVCCIRDVVVLPAGKGKNAPMTTAPACVSGLSPQQGKALRAAFEAGLADKRKDR